MTLTIYCYKKKDFGFQRLSPYIKDLIAHMTGIENVQNALSKDRSYDNAILEIFYKYCLRFCPTRS